MWNGIKMWEHKFQGMSEVCFMSFLLTEIPDRLLLFPAECPSSRYCLYGEILAWPGWIGSMYLWFWWRMAGKQQNSVGRRCNPEQGWLELQWDAQASKAGLFSEQLHSVLFVSVLLNCSFRVSMSTCSLCQGSSDECPAPVSWAQLTLLFERPFKMQQSLRWAPFGSRLVIKQSSNCGVTRLIQHWSLTWTEFFLWGFPAVNSLCNLSVCILRLLGIETEGLQSQKYWFYLCMQDDFWMGEDGNGILCGWWFVLLSKASEMQSTFLSVQPGWRFTGDLVMQNVFNKAGSSEDNSSLDFSSWLEGAHVPFRGWGSAGSCTWKSNTDKWFQCVSTSPQNQRHLFAAIVQPVCLKTPPKPLSW